MSLDRDKIENLTRRVDELVVILNGIMEDLRQVSASLKSIAVSQISKPITAPPISHALPQALEKSKALEDVKMMFPDDLEDLLSFEEKEDYIVIKPRQFLGSENFSKIASAVRGMGGEYVSAGKASHFRVPKRPTGPV
jgi:response regulator of citrate/malate metabolism